MPILETESGRTVDLPESLDLTQVAGLDEDGRIVVDWFDARAKGKDGDFLFGLTLCCNASDKGCEDGVYCRSCYGGAPNADEGNYLFRKADGTFPGLDPTKEIR